MITIFLLTTKYNPDNQQIKASPSLRFVDKAGKKPTQNIDKHNKV